MAVRMEGILCGDVTDIEGRRRYFRNIKTSDPPTTEFSWTNRADFEPFGPTRPPKSIRTPDAVVERSCLVELASGTTPISVASDLFDSAEHEELRRSHQAPKTSERTAPVDTLKGETQAVTIRSVVPTGPIKSLGSAARPRARQTRRRKGGTGP